MKLDFAAIQTLGEDKKPLTEPHRASQTIDARTDGTSVEIGGRAVYKLGQEQRSRAKTQEAYLAYQENIKRAGTLTCEILRGIQSGIDAAEILLLALECISRLTGDTLFYEQGRGELLSIYGLGLRNSAALGVKIEEAKARLAKLTRSDLAEAELTQEDRQRIDRAAAAYRNKIAVWEREMEASP